MPNEIDTAMDEIFAGKRIEKEKRKPWIWESEAGITAEEEALEEPGIVGTMLNPAEVFINALTGGGMALRYGRPALKEALDWATYGMRPLAGGIGKAIGRVFKKKPPSMFVGKPVRVGEEAGSQALATQPGRFTHRPVEDVMDISPVRSLKEPAQLAGAIERKQLPQYAGPTAPRGIPQPYAPQSWRERTFPGSIKRAQDVIEDLFRESLRAKGMIGETESITKQSFRSLGAAAKKIEEVPGLVNLSIIKKMASKYGGKVEDESSGRWIVHQINAPEGKLWADGGVSSIKVEYLPGKFGGRKEALQDAIERMKAGFIKE